MNDHNTPGNMPLDERISKDILKNIRWMIRIQAWFRGAYTRKKVQEIRDAYRPKNLQFADVDYWETLDELRMIEPALFRTENQIQLQ